MLLLRIVFNPISRLLCSWCRTVSNWYQGARPCWWDRVWEGAQVWAQVYRVWRSSSVHMSGWISAAHERLQLCWWVRILFHLDCTDLYDKAPQKRGGKCRSIDLSVATEHRIRKSKICRSVLKGGHYRLNGRITLIPIILQPLLDRLCMLYADVFQNSVDPVLLRRNLFYQEIKSFFGWRHSRVYP